MKLFELEAKDVETGYYDPSQDEFTKRKMGDTRRPRVTLRKVNKMKKMRALKKMENLKRKDLLGVIYAAPDEAAGGGMGF